MSRYNINYNFTLPNTEDNPVTIKISFASLGGDCDSAMSYLESKMESINNEYNLMYKSQSYQLNFTSGSFLSCDSL
jgi:hypothetical protein